MLLATCIVCASSPTLADDDREPGKEGIEEGAPAGGGDDGDEDEGTPFGEEIDVGATAEGIYLILWGYQGKQHTYTAGERSKLQSLVDHLVGMNYKVYEDGASYDQSKIDKAYEPNERQLNPKQVLIDWNATKANLSRYLRTRNLKGIIWMSHGYMEPWPQNAGDDLKKFESRVWSAEPGDPSETESRVFVREWAAALQGNPRSHFLVMHACATGGLAGHPEYAREPWEYTMDSTKQRAQTHFGQLPPLSELTLTTFDSLAGTTEYLKTYDGASYFGLNDVNIPRLIALATD